MWQNTHPFWVAELVMLYCKPQNLQVLLADRPPWLPARVMVEGLRDGMAYLEPVPRELLLFNVSTTQSAP